jgi:ABC-type Fe3+ transport system substrate-binding protein
VVLVAAGPNPNGGRQFIDFLLQPEIEQALAESEAAQMPLRSFVDVPEHVKRLDEIKPMNVNYETLADELENLSAGFLADWVAAHGQ